MRRKTITIVMVNLLLVGCAPTVWDRAGTTPAQFSQDNARCRLLARGMNSGEFYAEGKPAFVAGAAIGNAIGTAVATNETYKDCMMATGYTAETPQTQATVAKVKPIVTQAATCFATLYSSPEAEPIRRHTPLNAAEATPAQVADPATASPDEVAAINLVYPRLQECQNKVLADTITAAPTLAALLAQSYAKAAENITALKERRMTWGALNTQRQASARDFQTKALAAIQQ